MNKKNVRSFKPYMLVGVVLWILVLKSGVHATLAGIMLAIFIPLDKDKPESESLLVKLEHDLQSSVTYFILPLFAFANAGINFSGFSFMDLFQPVPLGIGLGLIIGNQVGIFSGVWLTVKSGLAKLPNNITWSQIYGVAALCGIGFTMSLFIASLAFDQTQARIVNDVRMGIVAGSIVSGIIGYTILKLTTERAN